MEDAEEVTAATADPVVLGQNKRFVKVALSRYLSYTGRCSKGMRRHGGSTEETAEALEEATAATADSATIRAKGARVSGAAMSDTQMQPRDACDAGTSSS